MISDDDNDLLKVKKKASALTADEQLIAKFGEINEFFAQNGCEPKTENFHTITEFQLASRLKAIRNKPEQYMALVDYDIYDLLPEHRD